MNFFISKENLIRPKDLEELRKYPRKKQKRLLKKAAKLTLVISILIEVMIVSTEASKAVDSLEKIQAYRDSIEESIKILSKPSKLCIVSKVFLKFMSHLIAYTSKTTGLITKSLLTKLLAFERSLVGMIMLSVTNCVNCGAAVIGDAKGKVITKYCIMCRHYATKARLGMKLQVRKALEEALKKTAS